MKAFGLFIILTLVVVMSLAYTTVMAQGTLPPVCSGVQLQNKGSANADTVTLSFYHQGDNDSISEYDYPVPGGIAPNVSKSYYMPSLLPGTVPSGSYSVVINSTERLNSLVNQVDCDLGAPRVGASHSGFEDVDIDSTIYLGYVLSRAFAQGWSSAVAIQNAGGSAASVTIDFFRSGQSTAIQSFTNNNLASGETWYLDLSSGTYATPALLNFSGSAKITGSQPLAAIANYAPADGSRMLSYNGTKLTSQKLYATQIMKHYTADDYTGGFVLYNPNATATPISLKFYQTGSTTPICTINDSIAAFASYIRYVGSIAACNTGSIGTGYNGYMVAEVTSGANGILGIFNFDSAAGQAGAANMMGVEQASTVLYFPQIVRNYSGFQSGWQVVNTSSSNLTLTVDYYRVTGTLSHTVNMPLAANANLTVYVGSITQLGDNWNGGAKITVQGGAGNIVGQANFISLGVVETLMIYNGFTP